MSASPAADPRPRRRLVWLTAIIVVVAIVVIVVVHAAGGPTEPPVAGRFARPASQTWDSGVFADYGPTKDQQFAAWRGAPLQTATDFISAKTWAQIADPAPTLQLWSSAPNVRLVLSTQMWPDSGGSLAEAAAGNYNTYFTQLAQNLVAAGRGDTIMRLGWEFNFTYPWSVTTIDQAHQYAAAWRQIITAMRSVYGAHFGFVWNPLLLDSGVDPAAAYPGDGYVTAIGLDVYDQTTTAAASSQDRWNSLVNAKYGLTWQADFADAHHQPIAFPEWGLVENSTHPSLGGSDDPYFISSMRRWFADHNTAFEDYFDVDTTYGIYYGIHTDRNGFPNAAALYRRLWSGAS